MNVLLALVRVGAFISSVGLIVVTLVQVTKAETGGGDSMGFGTLGGRGGSNVAVGADRFLKPLAMWFGVTFIVTAALLAVPEERFTRAAFVGLALYIPIMMFRHAIAARLKEIFPTVFGHEV